MLSEHLISFRNKLKQNHFRPQDSGIILLLSYLVSLNA